MDKENQTLYYIKTMLDYLYLSAFPFEKKTLYFQASFVLNKKNLLFSKISAWARLFKTPIKLISD